MKADAREHTFLVRLRCDATGEVRWRGSVREVSTGKRRFISEIRDIADFIASYLHAEDSPDTK